MSSMTSTRTVRASVSGRVQGVAYRMSLMREATSLGLAGWVRNSPDGRVLFLASGPPESVAALLEWARRGPAYARVDVLETVEVDEQPPATFEIRY